MRVPAAIAFFLFAITSLPAAYAQQTGTPPPPPASLRIGGNVMAAKLIHKVVPLYPPNAKAVGVSGTVVLHVLLRKDGSVADIKVISGPDLLTPAAVDAVKQWKYQPTTLNGQPVEVDTTVSVVFTLGPSQEEAPVDVSEHISLKDGTKINGKLISIDGDTFHIETSFSEINVPRSQIMSITFGADADDHITKVVSLVNPVRQTIASNTYTNETAHFTLTVPADWKTDDELAKKTTGAIGALSSTDPHERILIQTMPPGAPAKETAQLIASSLKMTFQGFQESDEAPVRIDNRDAYTLTFSAIIPLGNVRTQEGTDEPADTTVKAVVKYLVAIVPMEDRTVMIMCVAPETMYAQVDPLFHQIVMSFHAVPAAATASTAKP
jgi:TonB family protein